MESTLNSRLFSICILLVMFPAAYVAFGYAADSSWFPRILIIFLILMAFLLLARSGGFKTATTSDKPLPDTESNDQLPATQQSDQLKAAGLVLGSLIMYIAAIKLVNFEIASYLFMVVSMWVLGNRNPVLIAIVATAVMVLLKVVFFIFLDISRPSSLFF